MYEVEVNSRDTLAESIEANYDEWLKFAKERKCKRVVEIPNTEKELLYLNKLLKT